MAARNRPQAVPEYVTLGKDQKECWEPGLAAEITSRRQHRPKKNVEDTAPIPCDPNAVAQYTPEARAEWLEKAFGGIPQGRCKVPDVFEVLTHRKFASGLPAALGQKMLQSVKESLVLFTDKQRMVIAKCQLAQEFKLKGEKKSSRRDEEDDDRDRGRERRSPSRDRERGRDRERRSPSRRRHKSRSRSRDEGAKQAKHDRVENAPEKEREASPELDEEPLLSQEQLRLMAEAEAEKERVRNEALQKQEADRRFYEERERQRKANIGNAFLMADDDDEDEEEITQPIVLRREGAKVDELPSRSSGGRGPDGSKAATALQVMGNDSVIAGSFEILERKAGQELQKRGSPRRKSKSRGRRGNNKRRSRSRSRSRSRKVRSPGRGSGHARTFHSNRSPTPDGHLRGQMRAARKAKMMMQMMQQGNVPRV